MKAIVQLSLVVGWVVGMVLAKGFWSTLFALFIPLWGYYLIAELFVTRYLNV
jgi:hypothetical protein